MRVGWGWTGNAGPGSNGIQTTVDVALLHIFTDILSSPYNRTRVKDGWDILRR
jgi:hypothetical protein